jgi:sulfide:quinone oxidoreductase
MIKVSDNFYVSSQIDDSHIGYLKEQGFNLVVCNRPNDEEQGQTGFEQIEQACIEADISFINLPMVPGNLTSELITETKAIIDKNIKTIAYCRTGTRCINLWACANAIEGNIEETIELGTEAGYDLDHLRPVLKEINSSS